MPDTEIIEETLGGKKAAQGIYRISIHIDREDMAKLKSKAYGEGFKSMSECLRRMVADYIKN